MPVERRGLTAHAVFIKKEGRGEMRKAPISLQDLRGRLYIKAKTELVSAGSGGAGLGCTERWDTLWSTAAPRCRRLGSRSRPIGPITLGVKCAGARSAGNPHATCDVAGAGNGATVPPKRARRGKPRTQAKEYT